MWAHALLLKNKVLALLERLKNINNVKILTLRMYCRRIWYAVAHWFNSPQQWVYDVVPRACYMDQYQVVENVLYAAVVDFVEREKCFEVIDWTVNEHYKTVGHFIQECYNWIKIERPKLQQKIDRIINDASKAQSFEEMIAELNNPDRKSYDELYPGLNEAEAKLEEQDDYFFAGIVKYRMHLWV